MAVIDGAIKLFGTVFPFVAQKHRSQLLAHFAECIRQAKSSRQQAIQTNILTAFLFSLKVFTIIQLLTELMSTILSFTFIHLLITVVYLV